MEIRAALLPPVGDVCGALHLPLLPSRRSVSSNLVTRDALVAEALAARRVFNHTRFVSALTALARGRALREVEPIARLASGAYGLEAVELVATIAGRWVHALRPSTADRHRVAQTLAPKLHALPVRAPAMAALLGLQPRAKHWLWFTGRGLEPLLHFGLLRTELARSPTLRASLDRAATHSSRAAEWARWASFIATEEPCPCTDCARPLRLVQ